MLRELQYIDAHCSLQDSPCTDTTGIKHGTNQMACWAPAHCTSPLAGLRLTYSQGSPPIGADKEEEAGQPRELVWLLHLPRQSQVTPSKWHPRLVLHEPDIQDEAELRFVRTLGAGLFEVGEHFDEGGEKRGWLDTPYGV